jgi:hypothetical protein
VFGAGQSWPNSPDPGAEKSPDQLEDRGGEDLKEALGDEPTWMWRWQAAIFGRRALRQALDLRRLAVRTWEKILGRVGAMARCATPDHENKRLGHWAACNRRGWLG